MTDDSTNFSDGLWTKIFIERNVEQQFILFEINDKPINDDQGNNWKPSLLEHPDSFRMNLRTVRKLFPFILKLKFR